MTSSSVAERPIVAGLSLRVLGICLLMLLATMLNYMDRQALAQQAAEIGDELKLSNEQYAGLESGFGLAFALGGLAAGFAVDKLGPRLLYPGVLLAWSGVGFATGLARTYQDLLICRICLGFFESGLWPCALVTSQRLLSRKDRPLGNSLIQSGASLGAIATPIVVLLLAREGPGGWRVPFQVIGVLGLFWAIAWLLAVRASDLALDGAGPELAPELDTSDAHSALDPAEAPTMLRTLSRLLAVAIVVIVINLCFQYFRAWMPKMLRQQHGYSAQQVQFVSVAFYISADIGCLAVGFLVKRLANRLKSIHRARMALFLGCSILTALSTVAAVTPASPLLIVLLIVIAFGALGVFPLYYAFTQEISAKRMGNVTGLLGFVFWFVYGIVQTPIGALIDRMGTYSPVMFIAGLLPLVGFATLLLLWNPITRAERPSA